MRVFAAGRDLPQVAVQPLDGARAGCRRIGPGAGGLHPQPQARAVDIDVEDRHIRRGVLSPRAQPLGQSTYLVCRRIVPRNVLLMHASSIEPGLLGLVVGRRAKAIGAGDPGLVGHALEKAFPVALAGVFRKQALSDYVFVRAIQKYPIDSLRI